jgi:hypothetical protein
VGKSPNHPSSAPLKGAAVLAALSDDAQKAYAAVSAMEQAYKVAYLLPHEEQDLEKSSPMGWYSAAIHEAAGPVRLACMLPADIRELFTPLDQVLMYRLLGLISPTIVPVQLDAFSQALPFVPMPFKVVMTTNPGVADAVDGLIADSPLPVLHASTIAGTSRTPFESLNIAGLANYVRRTLEAMMRDPKQADIARQIRRAIAGSPQRKQKKHWLALGMHNLTAPNELALSSFGWKFVRQDPISVPISDPEEGRDLRYVDRICKAADAVFEERRALTSKLRDGLIDSRYVIAVASMYWGHYAKWRDYSKSANTADLRKQIKLALVDTVQAQTYFGNIQVDESRRPAMGKVYMLMRQFYAADMSAFTSGLSMLSSATLVPVLRLEPRLNQIRGDMKILAHCVRAEARRNHNWKVSRLTTALGVRMRSLINPEFLKRIDAPEPGDRIEGMKLVSDLPLELLPTQGLPLGLRFDTSRLPPVPGNMFWQECMLPPRLIPLSAFDEILVVRSFQPTDPLRNYLERAITTVARPGRVDRIRYRFVDVETEAEFIAAIKSYQGAVFIFDGHGTYDPELGMGSLVVGSKPLSVWNMRREVTLPPIVMFSACDTQPIDGSHSSVATAAFALGAHAVLGTLFPIDGFQAAVFNARLLLRLNQFLPIALKIQPQVTWRSVVSGMLRMTYATEVSRSLNRALRMNLDAKVLARLQMASNTAINSGYAGWHRVFLEQLAQVAGRSADDIAKGIQQHCALPDSAKYVQLGNPERVIIVREHPQETFSRGLKEWERQNGIT